MKTQITYNKARIKPNGCANVYIQIIIDRQRERINLDFDWPISAIDKHLNRILPRFANDTAYQDYTILINQELAKINEIIRLARLGGKKLTANQFKNEYKNFENKESFVAYMSRKITERFDKGIIRERTMESHRSSLNSLMSFDTRLLLSEISKQKMIDYKAFLFNKLNYDGDTVIKKLAGVRAYMNLALEEGYVFTYPFGKGFKMPKEQRRLEYLDEDEFFKLKNYWNNGQLEFGSQKEKSLRCYLAMCYSGIRLGDFQRLKHSQISRDVLYFEPEKALKEKRKTVELPLHPEFKKLVISKKGLLFDFPSSETMMRKSMASIAKEIGLQSTCSPHSGRHTFATRFLRAGGRLEVLKELLGHDDIKSTMIYVHVDLARKKAEMGLMN